MNRSKNRNEITEKKVTVNAETLAAMLDCGRATAVKVGDAAGARIKIGKRLLFKLDKVNEYLTRLADQEDC